MTKVVSTTAAAEIIIHLDTSYQGLTLLPEIR